MSTESSFTCSTVLSEVNAPRTTSTNRIMGTGLKKCIPATCSGLWVADAISEIESPEVLVNNRASWAATMLSSFLKVSFLRFISSKMASTITSASLTISKSVENSILESTPSRSCSDIFPLDTRVSRFFSTFFIPLSMLRWSTSVPQTLKPAWAKACVMLMPTLPTPITRNLISFEISILHSSFILTLQNTH